MLVERVRDNALIISASILISSLISLFLGVVRAVLPGVVVEDLPDTDSSTATLLVSSRGEFCSEEPPLIDATTVVASLSGFSPSPPSYCLLPLLLVTSDLFSPSFSSLSLVSSSSSLSSSPSSSSIGKYRSALGRTSQRSSSSRLCRKAWSNSSAAVGRLSLGSRQAFTKLCARRFDCSISSNSGGNSP